MNYQKKINVGKDFHHDSASLQVSGEAIYIDDMIKNSELMHASLVTSDIACGCLLYTSPSPRDRSLSRMPSSA